MYFKCRPFFDVLCLIFTIIILCEGVHVTWFNILIRIFLFFNVPIFSQNTKELKLILSSRLIIEFKTYFHFTIIDTCNFFVFILNRDNFTYLYFLKVTLSGIINVQEKFKEVFYLLQASLCIASCFKY